ncbi:MAG TPA: DNA polymerase III subunit gamma/tau [Candidatus Saccharimonadales bacterium]|nr:DNA polymerase III subunit gamma/tau [Candidatus Saccharimonadales bacterium]
MGQALYRKHRPKKLSEVVGQEHITKTLSEALKQGRISHAYLFTGPRGVGKTSIARILAHEINGLPYDDDTAHIDIIEIDAASNRRIDEIRDLRDKVHIAPTSAKYKVYIIDEVHMLTREAFNALLKTLEEPPAHVVFILATTDAHKLPETIISRTQRYNFRPVAKQSVVDHLAAIAKQEKIKISPAALELLAEHGEGSFRDSISLLDQAGNHGKQIELDDVQQLLGIPPREAVAGLLKRLSDTAEVAGVISDLTSLYDQGYQAAAIAKQLGQLIRAQLVAGSCALAADRALALLERLLEVPSARDPERLLEIVLLESMNRAANGGLPAAATAEVTVEIEPPAAKTVAEPAAKPVEPPPEPSKPPAPKAAKAAPKPAAESAGAHVAPARQFDAKLWPEVLAALKQKHNTLYGVVRMAEPRFLDDGTVELAFAFAFHQKRLNETANRQKLLDTIQGLTGHAVIIECTLDQSVKPASPEVSQPAAAEASAELSTISNIFGGGELLES